MMAADETGLREALLNVGGADRAGAPDPAREARAAVERDRRRVARLAVLTVAVWALSAAAIASALVAFGFLLPRQALHRRDVESGALSPERRERAEGELLHAFQVGTVAIGLAVAGLAGSALCTVWLVLASRRATLRQIN